MHRCIPMLNRAQTFFYFQQIGTHPAPKLRRRQRSLLLCFAETVDKIESTSFCIY